MTQLLTILMLLMTISSTYAQISKPAVVPVSEASSMINLAPGLSFVDAYEVPMVDNNLADIRSNEVFRGNFFNDNNNFIKVANHAFIENSVGDNVMVGGSVVRPNIIYIYDIVKGASIIAKARLFNTGTVTTLKPISFENDVLLIYAVYFLDVNNQESRRRAMIRISGNWDRYTSEPLFELSADINKDNRVNPLDLLLLQEQWQEITR